MTSSRNIFTQAYVGIGSAPLILALSSSVNAEQTLYTKNGISINLSTKVATAAFTSNDTNFGVGRVDFFSGENTGDATWQEAYIKPGFNFEWQQNGNSTIYGALSFVGAVTSGDGDAGGFTNSGTDVDLEHFYIGLRGEVFDISIGAQDYIIGDGFILMDGNFDAAEEAAFWVLPRTAFRNSAIFDFNTKLISGEIFYLQADNHQDDTELVGINLEYTNQIFGTFGASYLNIISADTATSHIPATSRNGMEVISIRSNRAKIPGLSAFTWHAEYVKEFGKAEGKSGDFGGEAWYIEGNYFLSDFIWTPTITYRFAHFSGDSGADNNQDSFDPLFYSFNPDRNGGWGSWFQGEVVGNYLLFNSNQNNHMLKLDIKPAATFGLGLIYYSFDLDENNYFGIPVTDKDFAKEINVYAEWYPTDRFYAAVAGGIAFPGPAAEQVFNNNKNYAIFEIYAAYKF